MIASDVTELRKLKNTINNIPINNSGIRTRNLKFNTIIKGCSHINTCDHPCGYAAKCSPGDDLGLAKITYFGSPINFDVSNCKIHNVSSKQFQHPMFQTPLMQIRPAIKKIINSVECCNYKNIKNSKIVETRVIFKSNPVFPTKCMSSV